jgi:hypothetical protein
MMDGGGTVKGLAGNLESKDSTNLVFLYVCS